MALPSCSVLRQTASVWQKIDYKMPSDYCPQNAYEPGMLSAIGHLAAVVVGIPFLIGAQGAWLIGGAARPTKITTPSPPGLQQRSISKSGFQLLSDQMLPA